jgi:LacI family transcriptional regulator
MLVNRRLQEDRSNYVVIDNEYGAYLVVNHLIRLGYKRIAIITGPKTTSTGRDRHRGYLEAVNDKGLEVIPELVKEGRFFSQSTGYDNTKLLMSQNSPPEAIFCSDDHIAFGAMWALAEMDLNVPSDVALVGFDDVWISSHPRIQLTTVSQDVAEMGRLAGKIIVDTLEGRLEEPKRLYLEPNLKIRSSCGYRLRAGQKNNPD